MSGKEMQRLFEKDWLEKSSSKGSHVKGLEKKLQKRLKGIKFYHFKIHKEKKGYWAECIEIPGLFNSGRDACRIKIECCGGVKLNFRRTS